MAAKPKFDVLKVVIVCAIACCAAAVFYRLEVTRRTAAMERTLGPIGHPNPGGPAILPDFPPYTERDEQ